MTTEEFVKSLLGKKVLGRISKDGYLISELEGELQVAFNTDFWWVSSKEGHLFIPKKSVDDACMMGKTPIITANL